MPQVINISDEEIRYAERLLLPVGKTFDEERRTFIRNFNTIDLQAVPGSGKTTALLAKLVILEKKLPFADGSGILVLSHTNAAIDEIKEKIQKHCPKLFSYPNFIGTIQSFVDAFLAIPFYVSKFKKKPIRIDNEIYNERIKSFLDKIWLHRFNLSEETNTKVAHIKNNNEAIFYNYRFKLSNEIQLVKKLNEDVLEISKPRGNTRPQNYRDYTQQEKQEVYNWFLALKKSILKSGILHFDDAYFLADIYLKKIPSVKTILQKRFSFVFVDEMQDMDTHQYDLLEKIFYDEGNSVSKIQRIGDKNQAIYNSVKATDIWQDRAEVLRLNGSQRLSKPIADVVKKFALYSDNDFDIIGIYECEIKPHILVFEDNAIGNIIPCFAQIVRENNLINSGKPIKVVCWNTEWNDDAGRQDATKLRLEDYHQGFKKEKGKPKQDYDNLKSYLLYYEKKQTLEPLRKNILNAFLKILRLESINTADNRPYTKKVLIDLIHENDIQKYDELNLNLYNWSIGIIQGKTSEVFMSIKEYIPTLLAIFDKQMFESLNFINNDNAEIPIENAEILASTNYYKEEGLEIEITSVHAVKGQTHCATLYLESYFQQDGQGINAKSYESQRLKDQFLGIQIQSNVRDRVKQSTKMAYVGFSRPTDLLCIAIHKNRFDAQLNGIDTDVWEIKTV
ncbi:UvrD-helicase domain-containing protein [Sphingobacterium sp. HMA12]|uniref:UvrD-helicase domain-containing protein n=1 Tax=Sphingobacterium sp. HMA12 TaxID=2050894 RepID=UPI000CEA31A2|nr:UvrD-helicase domain-containing protein [Sphingobacterium sp. HMA12]